MLTELQNNLNTIHSEIMEKLIPENIKKDVTILNVTGTLETSTISAEGIKHFATIEEMNTDANPKENDLAIVYREEIQNATVDSRFSQAKFPATVVLPEAMTDYVDVRYRAVDTSIMFDCWGNLDSSRFSMDCWSDTGSIRIEYESSDGMTYTRTDGGEEFVDFGTEIYYEYTDMWNDAIGYFIQARGYTFDGLYKSTLIDDTTKSPLYHAMVYNSEQSLLDYQTTFMSTDLLNRAYTLFSEYITNQGFEFHSAYLEYVNDTSINFRYAIHNINKRVTCGLLLLKDNNELYHSTSTYAGTNSNIIHIANINLTNGTVTELSSFSTEKYKYSTSATYPYVDYCTTPITNPICEISYGKIDEVSVQLFTTLEYITDIKIEYNKILKYLLAPTQLSTTSDYVYGKTFYGKNGVETGTLQNKKNLTNDEVKHRVDIWSNYNSGIICPSNASSMFTGCTNLTTIPLLNTSSVTNMNYMFYGCTNLTEIPLLDTSNVTNMISMFGDCTNLTTIPLLNTSNVTAMDSMFYGCTNLTEIPLLDTSNVTSMASMFNRCTKLTTILQLDTSSVTRMDYMFQGCTNLTEIPLLDTSSVTTMNSMFSSCTSLSDESLNNILAMCTNATSYTNFKKLLYIGLTSEQATKCTTLSNYQAFLDAGWTTGY